jgi:hypothetical protein
MYASAVSCALSVAAHRFGGITMLDVWTAVGLVVRVLDNVGGALDGLRLDVTLDADDGAADASAVVVGADGFARTCDEVQPVRERPASTAMPAEASNRAAMCIAGPQFRGS